MKAFKISEKIFLNHDAKVVWYTISSPCALELFHPFCQANSVLNWDEIKIDKLVYLNGSVYIREFSAWKPKKGFELNIGKKMEKNQKFNGKFMRLIRDLR